MLIPYSKCDQILKKSNINVNGILHIGAHECEEFNDYVNNGVNPDNIIWIEANPKIADKMKNLGFKNINCFAVDNEEGEAVFNITNNGQSSSLLALGTHKDSYPYIYVSETITVQKKRLHSFFKENNDIDFQKYNFWNLDIQGLELNALKSCDDYINYVDAIYSEINTQYVYQNCGLLNEMDIFLNSKGFVRVCTEMTNAGWGDALWIRSK